MVPTLLDSHDSMIVLVMVLDIKYKLCINSDHYTPPYQTFILEMAIVA